jgi:hypothetical protein
MTQAEINITILHILKMSSGHLLHEERVREHADVNVKPRPSDEQFQLALTTLKDHGFADVEEDPLRGRLWFMTEKGRVYLKA